MERRLGHDFSRVQVHSGAAAEQSAREVQARAYTVGHQIVFAPGEYQPHTLSGRRLLAHELAHTVQQSDGAPLAIAREPDEPRFAVNQQDMVYLQNTMLNFYNLLTVDERASLQRNTAVVIALVTHANKPTLVYTVASNRTTPGIEAAMAQLGLVRWDPRGVPKVAGERHAEQLATTTASELRFKVHGIAVTRTPCPDCGPLMAEKGIPIVWVRDPNPVPRTPAPPGASPAGGNPPPPPPGQPPAPGKTTTPSPAGKTQAVVGEPLAPVVEHGLSAAGTVAMNASPIALKLLGTLLNYFGDRKQAELAYEALQPKLAGIAQEQAAHPDQGVLLVYNYEQVTAGEASVVQPGRRFLTVRLAYGRTLDEARGHVQGSYASTQTGTGTRAVGDEVWSAPQQVDPSNFAHPFPDIALARFKPGREALQHIKWIRGSLSHSGSTSLPSPAKWGWAPFFYVLKTPESLRWTEPGGRTGTTTISLKTEATANGFSVAATAGTVPVFGADENTYNLFLAAKDAKTGDNNGELRYSNFDFVRWASPDDIEIVKVLSTEGVGATLPSLGESEVQIELANMPAPVRALYESLTHKGDTTTSGDVLARFLTVVPSDLTMEEVEHLTARQKKSESAEEFLDSLEKAIRKLPSRSGGQGDAAPGGGIDFRRGSAPSFAPAALTEQVRVLLGGVNWSQVKPEPTYFDNVIGKEGSTVNTLAYGLDDQGRHWGALVVVSVAKKDGGFTPVTVRSSTVLVSEQGEPLYGNSVLWGRTFRLKPE